MRTYLLITLLAALWIFQPTDASSQCSTTNATSCVCDEGGTNCDLLPDMTISWYALLNYLSGPNEQAGRIYISGSTPNIGHGPLEVRGVDLNGYRRFTCGVDTFTVYDPSGSQQFACPNGGTAKQLTTQRIFHKNGATMTSTERVMPQGMSYHPTHGHTHFDQWGIYSLRIAETGVSDPRAWPIVNEGYKLGFCLMDYNSCSDGAANNHCKDDNTVYNAGTTLHAADFPNYGLGGANYGCSMSRQGISSGYLDIYSEYLDGMWIDIPANTCNGNYWIVYEVDPLDVVKEEDETNNWTAVPITLTQQPAGSATAQITCDEQAYVCSGGEVRLKANAGTSYQWSTGATSNSIMAGPGTYTVTVTNYCGTATSSPFTVTALPQPAQPVAQGTTVCEGQSAELTATGTDLVWYNAVGDQVGSGSPFNTPPLFAGATYYVADQYNAPGNLIYGGKSSNSGSGEYHSGGQSLKFNALASFTLKSVMVYAGDPGVRTVELVDGTGVMRATRSAYVPLGMSRITLDFDITPGSNYLLNVAGFTDLWRSTSSITYPYAVGTVASITTSSAGSGSYPYFYDWEVEIGGGFCESVHTPVAVTVEVCSGIAEALPLRGIEVYPNPNNGQFTLSLYLLTDTRVQLSLLDALGRQVRTESAMAPSGNWRHVMDHTDLPKGLYTLSIDLAGRRFLRRVVLE
ncbi:MAG: T9SS type A sorting domain-containing protein [Flavobacteriales bacterium]|nr:T9SS type A sorting domain-containing protein [Flavobacteriales bacterium]